MTLNQSPQRRPGMRIQLPQPSKQTIVISETSSPIDEWGFSEEQVGSNLSQVLGRPDARTLRMRHRSRATVSSAARKPAESNTHKSDSDYSDNLSDPASLQKKATGHSQNDLYVDSGDADMAIAAMFADSEDDANTGKGNTIGPNGGANSGNGAASDKDILTIDASVSTEKKSESNDQKDERVLTDGEERFSSQGMEFMDEESVRNFQRILAEQRKKRRKTWLAEKRKEKTRPNPRRSLSRITDLPAPLSNELPDELPDNPLDIMDIPSGLAKRKRPATCRISDSEVSDDAEILDKRVIINNRLRDKSTNQSYREKLEQARIKAQSGSYNTDTPTDNELLAGDDFNNDNSTSAAPDLGLSMNGDEVVEFFDNGPKPGSRGLLDDMPETDSDNGKSTSKNKGKNSAVFVIEDSSDDNDFISDPEEPVLKKYEPMKRSEDTAAKSDSNSIMSNFLSAFKQVRGKKMPSKLNGKSGLGESSENPKGLFKGYSQEMDDDLMDFIVDDDDVSEEFTAEEPDESVVDNDAILNSPSKSHAFSPTFSRKKPRGVLALMPEEFSQCDLPTSFKAYVQYLVYWINNGRCKFESNKENARYFFLAYVTVNRVIRSIEQSLVSSSAWVDRFSKDLYSYPKYSSAKIYGSLGCDACHFRDKRTATFCITLSGKPYKQDMLVPPNPDDLDTRPPAERSPYSVECNDDLSSDSSAYYIDYNVGAVCKQRSETCHELHHYFLHLSDAVERHLRALDFSGFRKAFEPDSDDDEPWSGFDPDHLVEMLESQGQIDRLFAEFKDLLSRSKAGFAKNM
ncbi:hypothetical protein H4R99_004037 [Coemansia sp. RSA 1722]|nr:hypothetical protein H4R99_004037 [Coemansia sp. RSA 1722]